MSQMCLQKYLLVVEKIILYIQVYIIIVLIKNNKNIEFFIKKLNII